MTLPSKDQIRAARALLDWKQKDLAERVGVTTDMISKIEKGALNGSVDTLNAIVEAFDKAGLEFTNQGGVQQKKRDVVKLTGRPGLIEFFDDVYHTLKANPSEIVTSGVDESKFSHWLGDFSKPHRERMAQLEDITFRCLICEGDYNFKASEYGQYRWTPKEYFVDSTFYAYGEKIAFVTISDDVTVYIVNEPTVSLAYRGLFNVLWAISIDAMEAK